MLPYVDLLQVEQTCKHWNIVSKSSRLWVEFYFSDRKGYNITADSIHLDVSCHFGAGKRDRCKKKSHYEVSTLGTKQLKRLPTNFKSAFLSAELTRIVNLPLKCRNVEKAKESLLQVENYLTNLIMSGQTDQLPCFVEEYAKEQRRIYETVISQQKIYLRAKEMKNDLIRKKNLIRQAKLAAKAEAQRKRKCKRKKDNKGKNAALKQGNVKRAKIVLIE